MPAVIWAPDGSRVYAAYIYSFNSPDGAITVVAITSSTDKGFTWSPQTTTWYYIGFQYPVKSLKLATPLTVNNANWVYLLRGDCDNFCSVMFYL